MSERAIDKEAMKGKVAFVLGASGEVGKEVVKTLVDTKIFNSVVLIGRRELDYSDKGEGYKNLIQRIVNFDKLSESKDAFDGCEVGFCCLGTTRGKSGAAGFVKVDHDYVLESAQIAKEKGCTHFNLVSSMGANANSWLLYPKTKGQVENEIKALNFERYSIFRPATLMCDRVESRPGEKVIRGLLKPVQAIAPTLITIPTSTCAQGMIYNLFVSGGDPVETLENAKIHDLGKEFKKQFQE